MLVAVELVVVVLARVSGTRSPLERQGLPAVVSPRDGYLIVHRIASDLLYCRGVEDSLLELEEPTMAQQVGRHLLVGGQEVQLTY